LIIVDVSASTEAYQHCDTHYLSRPRTYNLPIVGPTRYDILFAPKLSGE